MIAACDIDMLFQQQRKKLPKEGLLAVAGAALRLSGHRPLHFEKSGNDQFGPDFLPASPGPVSRRISLADFSCNAASMVRTSS